MEKPMANGLANNLRDSAKMLSELGHNVAVMC
jgi:hypothetical protein